MRVSVCERASACERVSVSEHVSFLFLFFWCKT